MHGSAHWTWTGHALYVDRAIEVIALPQPPNRTAGKSGIASVGTHCLRCDVRRRYGTDLTAMSPISAEIHKVLSYTYLLALAGTHAYLERQARSLYSFGSD